MSPRPRREPLTAFRGPLLKTVRQERPRAPPNPAPEGLLPTCRAPRPAPEAACFHRPHSSQSIKSPRTPTWQIRDHGPPGSMPLLKGLWPQPRRQQGSVQPRSRAFPFKDPIHSVCCRLVNPDSRGRHSASHQTALPTPGSPEPSRPQGPRPAPRSQPLQTAKSPIESTKKQEDRAPNGPQKGRSRTARAETRRGMASAEPSTRRAAWRPRRCHAR